MTEGDCHSGRAHRPRRSVKDVRARASALHRPVAHHARMDRGAGSDQLAGELGRIAAASLPAGFQVIAMGVEDRRHGSSALLSRRRFPTQPTPHRLAIEAGGARHTGKPRRPLPQDVSVGVTCMTVGVLTRFRASSAVGGRTLWQQSESPRAHDRTQRDLPRDSGVWRATMACTARPRLHRRWKRSGTCWACGAPARTPSAKISARSRATISIPGCTETGRRSRLGSSLRAHAALSVLGASHGLAGRGSLERAEAVCRRPAT